MAHALGTLEELPLDYRESMTAAGVAPLWPMLRNLLPHGQPKPVTKPAHWSYAQIRPLLLRAGDLTPVEKAERRVLVLSDPGRGVGAMQATGSIYVGMQLLLPGETAPNHRHTASAARVVVEGAGGYTVVDGEKLPMDAGDLILTPGGLWHDHGHDGTEPVIWLDALDLPVFANLEGAYAVEAPLQAPKNRPDASQVEYTHAGLVPAKRYGRAVPAFPQMRYPWKRTEEALRKMAEYTDPQDAVELDYINPETGDDVLPTLGFSALMVRPGETVKPPLRSSSAVFHVISGSGKAVVNGEVMELKAKDSFSACVFATIDITNPGAEPLFLMRVHDRPIQTKFKYYEERERVA